MSFLKYNSKKKKGPSGQRAAYMTDRMNNVIQHYINHYNQKGFIQVDNSSVIRNIAVVVLPLMQSILTRYNEDDFHRKMNHIYTDEYGNKAYGFDFIGDWRSHHPFAFNIAMQIASSYKRNLKFDPSVATQLVVDIMKSWNWHPTLQEAQGIRHMLWRIRKLISNA
jgi:hypothetical protein